VNGPASRQTGGGGAGVVADAGAGTGAAARSAAALAGAGGSETSGAGTWLTDGGMGAAEAGAATLEAWPRGGTTRSAAGSTWALRRCGSRSPSGDSPSTSVSQPCVQP